MFLVWWLERVSTKAAPPDREDVTGVKTAPVVKGPSPAVKGDKQHVIFDCANGGWTNEHTDTSTPCQSSHPATPEHLPYAGPQTLQTVLAGVPEWDQSMEGDCQPMGEREHLQINPEDEGTVQPTTPTLAQPPYQAHVQPTSPEAPAVLHRSSRQRHQPVRYESEDFRKGT
ncbi:hypothetical protein HPB49_008600 [Dermacentor silvarum]|uniref:Uncharacterized protein n=1 Tax=Dermacentor silvarum TaxID=543639 RepID=A0ACB8C8M8_DERSI|nr:hypothetical protein HPB49_008600 [Dermacentor silvarum]